MELRKLNQSDVKDLHTLAVFTYRNAYRESLTKEELDLRINGQHRLDEFLQFLGDEEGHAFWGVFEDAKLVGYFHLNTRTKSETCVTDGHIEVVRLYVHSSHKGRNLGRALLEKAQEVCLNSGFQGLWLHCYDQNIEGILFYQKMGYKIAGRDAFEIVPGRKRFDLVFTKVLGQTAEK